MLKKAPNFVLGRSHRSTYGKKYASRLSLPPALLDDLFEHPGAGRAWVFLLLLLAASGFGGCGGSPARHAGYPVGYVERGVASWYGPGFHGNRTANGEQYDMHRLTAAHRTLPLGSVAQVRSLSNGRTVTVRINDRGPFARGRIIDLSLAAAEGLGMIGQGTDRGEMRVIGYQGRPGAFGSLRVQVASFAERLNAQALAGREGGGTGSTSGALTLSDRPRRLPTGSSPNCRLNHWSCGMIPERVRFSPLAGSFRTHVIVFATGLISFLAQ
ncbi:MAG: hypothetical protein AUH35_00275 [Nitrospirae bacterium 13_1_40CM_62_7]|nr:MAG: hypothetical protein AUH35_00275 [Nitrospirae bacterium 13_1_40CM_62_7]